MVPPSDSSFIFSLPPSDVGCNVCMDGSGVSDCGGVGVGRGTDADLGVGVGTGGDSFGVAGIVMVAWSLWACVILWLSSTCLVASSVEGEDG